jgi:hypothetical protein
MKRMYSVHSRERFAGFNSHPRLEGSHAFLSASNYAWLRYSDEKLVERLSTAEAAARGTRLHAWAAEAISLGRRQPKEDDENHDVLCAYINDAIELNLVPEQLLMHSLYAYGTADTIGFEPYIDDPKFAGFLRIHDYKSGVTKTSPDQLYIYAGYFCLEYDFRPYEIDGELRIYQSDVRIYELDREYLAYVYDRIRTANDIVEQRRMGGLI